MGLSSSNKLKGQFTTTEFLMIVFVLIFLITLATVIWNTVGKTIGEKTVKNELQSAAIDISDQLLKSQGLPTDWEGTSKIYSLGLVVGDHMIDEGKLRSMLNLPYSQIKSSLGIKTYEFYFKIVNLSGNIIQVDGKNAEVGLKPDTASNIVNSRRIAILNNQIVYADVITWR